MQFLLFLAGQLTAFSLYEPHEALGRLAWAPERPLCLWARHHWAPEGYRFPDTPVKSHFAGGKGSGCPQPSTEQRWSAPCHGQTCPWGTARFVATEKRREINVSDTNVNFKGGLFTCKELGQVWKKWPQWCRQNYLSLNRKACVTSSVETNKKLI